MAKIFPKRQTFVDEKVSSGEQVVVTRVVITSSTHDFVSLPGSALDAAILQSAKATADPTFYLTGRDTVFNIDGGTVGSELVVVSRHVMINTSKGDAA